MIQPNGDVALCAVPMCTLYKHSTLYVYKISTMIDVMCTQYTPCLEKNGTSNVLGITLTNTNV